MYTVYIIQSDKYGRYYTGHTHDLSARLKRHNSGSVKSTKPGMPWRVVHSENFHTKSEAFRREMEIKRYKSGLLFKKLLSK